MGLILMVIKQNEKVLNSDIRKINVTIKQAYTSKDTLNNVQAFYRIYVREGANTEVQVQDWTRINRTPDGHYFIFDTRDKIPNEYFVDIKVKTDRNIETFKRELQFQIVNKNNMKDLNGIIKNAIKKALTEQSNAEEVTVTAKRNPNSKPPEYRNNFETFISPDGRTIMVPYDLDAMVEKFSKSNYQDLILDTERLQKCIVIILHPMKTITLNHVMIRILKT